MAARPAMLLTLVPPSASQGWQERAMTVAVTRTVCSSFAIAMLRPRPQRRRKSEPWHAQSTPIRMSMVTATVRLWLRRRHATSWPPVSTTSPGPISGSGEGGRKVGSGCQLRAGWRLGVSAPPARETCMRLRVQPRQPRRRRATRTLSIHGCTAAVAASPSPRRNPPAASLPSYSPRSDAPWKDLRGTSTF